MVSCNDNHRSSLVGWILAASSLLPPAFRALSSDWLYSKMQLPVAPTPERRPLPPLYPACWILILGQLYPDHTYSMAHHSPISFSLSLSNWPIPLIISPFPSVPIRVLKNSSLAPLTRTWMCSTLRTLWILAQFLNHRTFSLPRCRVKVRSTKSSIITLASGVRSPAGTESSRVGIGDLVQHTRCTRGMSAQAHTS